jgi:hypothetical protein
MRVSHMQRLWAASFGYKYQSRFTGGYPWSIAKINLSVSTEYVPLVILNAICRFSRSLPFLLKVKIRKVYSNRVYISFRNVFIMILILHWLSRSLIAGTNIDLDGIPTLSRLGGLSALKSQRLYEWSYSYRWSLLCRTGGKISARHRRVPWSSRLGGRVGRLVTFPLKKYVVLAYFSKISWL